MKHRILAHALGVGAAITALLSTTGIVAPAKAQSPLRAKQPTSTQAQTTREQVANACIQNQAETLPIPFSDVSPDHWAFKAVMTMHYCGAFRQAAPPALFQSGARSQESEDRRLLTPGS